jgi:glycosyltransferase involved in cell wall biosynthesis
MPPMFSVVIATRNRPAYLSEALGSVLAQSYDEFEVLVIDDASDDPVHVPVDDRIRVVRLDSRRGAAGARNAGISRALGDWVVFLDDDDTWMAQRLERLADAIAVNPRWSLITTDAEVQREGRVVGRWYQDRAVPDDDQLAALLARNYIYTSAAVRRPRLERVGGFDETLGLREDYDLWLRLVRDGSIVGVVPEVLAMHRQGQGKAAEDRVRSLSVAIDILSRALGWDLQPREREAARRHIDRLSVRLDLQRAHAGELSPTTRRGWWAIARAKELPPSTRASALAAVITGRPVTRR